MSGETDYSDFSDHKKRKHAWHEEIGFADYADTIKKETIEKLNDDLVSIDLDSIDFGSFDFDSIDLDLEDIDLDLDSIDLDLGDIGGFYEPIEEIVRTWNEKLDGFDFDNFDVPIKKRP